MDEVITFPFQKRNAQNIYLIFSAIVAHPAELLKVRLQLQLEKDRGSRLYSGPLAVAKDIHHKFGFRGLYRAYYATLLFRTNMAVMFSTFEVNKNFIRFYDIIYLFIYYSQLSMRTLSKINENMSLGTASFISGGVSNVKRKYK